MRKIILLLISLFILGKMEINNNAWAEKQSAPPVYSTTTSNQSEDIDIEDARREAQLITSYNMSPHLRNYDLTVKVTGNKAILSGKVESNVEKDLAEQIAQGLRNIHHVDNRIVVEENYFPSKQEGAERGFNEKVEDATITATVKSKLLWNGKTDGLDLNVDTLNGKVTLRGSVSDGAEKALAAQLARNTDGVISVTNHLVVNPDFKRSSVTNNREESTSNEQSKADVSDAWITAKVKSTLVFSRNVHGLDITVATNNGIVSLAGTVSNPAERDLAVELAKNVRGVKKVDASRLKLSS